MLTTREQLRECDVEEISPESDTFQLCLKSDVNNGHLTWRPTCKLPINCVAESPSIWAPDTLHRLIRGESPWWHPAHATVWGIHRDDITLPNRRKAPSPRRRHWPLGNSDVSDVTRKDHRSSLTEQTASYNYFINWTSRGTNRANAPELLYYAYTS
jgi:hypothetical protein